MNGRLGRGAPTAGASLSFSYASLKHWIMDVVAFPRANDIQELAFVAIDSNQQVSR